VHTVQYGREVCFFLHWPQLPPIKASNKDPPARLLTYSKNDSVLFRGGGSFFGRCISHKTEFVTDCYPIRPSSHWFVRLTAFFFHVMYVYGPLVHQQPSSFNDQYLCLRFARCRCCAESSLRQGDSLERTVVESSHRRMASGQRRAIQKKQQK
jgi:hypothetical protein